MNDGGGGGREWLKCRCKAMLNKITTAGFEAMVHAMSKKKSV